MGLLIGEVARRAGLSTSALRYYERVGLLPPLAQMKSILNDSFQCRCMRIEDCEKYMPPSNRVAQ